jgi:hypothetical protein
MSFTLLLHFSVNIGPNALINIAYKKEHITSLCKLVQVIVALEISLAVIIATASIEIILTRPYSKGYNSSRSRMNSAKPAGALGSFHLKFGNFAILPPKISTMTFHESDVGEDELSPTPAGLSQHKSTSTLTSLLQLQLLFLVELACCCCCCYCC